MRLKEFPFDSQNFNIQLMSVDFSPEEVHFVPGPSNGIAEDISVADWSVTGFKSSTKPFIVSTSKMPLANFTVIIEAKRKNNYFWLKVILPLVLIVMMSWVVFWIDPQEGNTQISVAITSMLTLIAYRFAISTDIPQISYLTRLDFFVLGSTILVFAGLIEVLITSTYAKMGQIEKAQRIDIWSRVLFPVTFVLLMWESLLGIS
ncbi:MAG: hypothetical protein ACI8PB_002263 [Desulforhopalus sp.]